MKEKIIIHEILNDVKKNFNKTSNHYSNQQLTGHKDLIRGVIVKKWIMRNQGRINFHQHNKLLVKSCVQHYHEVWKCGCVLLHNPEVQMKVLKDKVLNMMEKASKD